MIPQRREGSLSSHRHSSVSCSWPVVFMQFSEAGLLRRTRRMFGVGNVIIVFRTGGGAEVKVVSDMFDFTGCGLED